MPRAHFRPVRLLLHDVSLNQPKEGVHLMNTTDRSDTDLFTVEELEARFEMEALSVAPGDALELDWKCGCTFEA